MKTSTILTLMATSVFSFFAPIAVTICILMGFILVDTLMKVGSIYFIAKREDRKFFDVFKSKILRVKFILKSLGYMALAFPVAILDIKIITPTIKWALENFTKYTVPTEALTANVLIVIFCLMELSSINENWNVITRVNLFKSVSKVTIKVRDIIISIMSFFKSIKSDISQFKSTESTNEQNNENNVH